MAIELSPNVLQGPIPGMSLTKEPGSVPWENPSQLVTIEETMEYYNEKLLDFEVEDSFLKAIDNGISIEKLSEMLIMSHTMNGIHNLDVGILVNPYVRELMRLVADEAEVEYIDSYTEKAKENKVPYRILRKYIQETIADDTSGEIEEETTPMPQGLMAKQSAPDVEPDMQETEEELPQEISEEGLK